MKKQFVFMLAIAMLLPLCACGKETEPPEEAGSYTLLEMTYEGEVFDSTFLESVGMDQLFTLELKEDGTGILKMEDEEFSLAWKNGTIRIANGGGTYTYTYQDRTITLEETTGDTMTFRKRGSVRSTAESNAPMTTLPQALTAAQEYWNGDWYGWLLVTSGRNAYADWEGYYWDCMSRIRVDEKGGGSLILWDEASAADNPTAQMEIAISDNGSEQGQLQTPSGSFWDCEVGNSGWVADPEPTDYAHLIVIEGTYTDPEDFYSGFDYEIYLRPWGMDWADVEAEMPDSLPVHYDWYLSAIGTGMEMPDVIGGGSTLAPGEVQDGQMEDQGGGNG